MGPDSIPLSAEDIFTPSIRANAIKDMESLAKKKTTDKEILEIIKEINRENSLYFYSGYSTDTDFQILKKEVSVIRAAGEYAKLSLDIIEKNTASSCCGEKEIVFLASVKQLLSDAAKEANPLAVKIEKLIQEKEWEDEGEYSGSSDQFFDIMELEAEIPYLKKTSNKLYGAVKRISLFIGTQT
ncbi:MAG: hypothetical protein RBT69_00415 [Spirochaetia bacterium]|jgi:hypothetical protein|nr:hypothetical protein [Spirochaetia bacterium]